MMAKSAVQNYTLHHRVHEGHGGNMVFSSGSDLLSSVSSVVES